MTTQEIDVFSDGPTFEDQASTFGDGLLRVHWFNGDPKAKTPGGFWVETEQLEKFGIQTPEAPWKESSRTFDDGRTKEGYVTPAVKIALIGWRKQDAVANQAGIERFLPFGQRIDKTARPQGWTVVVEALVMLQGFGTDLLVIRSNRIKTSMALLIDIFQTADKEIFADAKRAAEAAGKTVYRWSFWLPVRGLKEADGSPKFEKTLGRQVTPPALILPEGKTGRELWSALYTGPEIVKAGIGYRQGFDKWLGEPIGGDGAAQPAVSPKNAVQTISDDDLPF